MRHPIDALAVASVVFAGAIFGFFYAWICSTMWGLDAADPRIAIASMQAMNASVRNFAFAPAFFGTPFVLMLTAFFAWRARATPAAILFASGGLSYLAFGMILTMTINVPMNLALANVVIPDEIEAARDIWTAYSGDWQFWNMARTLASGLSLVLAAAGTIAIGRHRREAA